MKYVDLRLALPEELLHPMMAFIRHGDVVQYEEIVAWSVVPEERVEYELFYVEADREPYEAQVQTVESVLEYRIAPIDDDAFHVYARSETRETERRWRTAFASLDLLVVPPIAYDAEAGLHVTVVGDGDDVQAMLDSLPDGVEVDVKEIGTYERRRGLGSGLTERQREAVEAALALGYYDVPREATLADVASRLDCAEGTASELLRRAAASALSALVDRRRLR